MAMSTTTQAKFPAGTSATNGSMMGKSNYANNSNVTVTNVIVENNAKGEELKQKQAMNVWNESILKPRNEGQSKSPGNGMKSQADKAKEKPGQTGKRNSIWDEFGITKLSNVGFKLEYIQPKLYGESRVSTIELEDISSEIEYWQNAIVCYVLGVHPLFTVIQGYIKKLWAKHGINKISMLKNGVILVRFDSTIAKQEVLNVWICHFDNKPFIVKAWSPYLEFTRQKLLNVPIWGEISKSRL